MMIAVNARATGLMCTSPVPTWRGQGASPPPPLSFVGSALAGESTTLRTVALLSRYWSAFPLGRASIR